MDLQFCPIMLEQNKSKHKRVRLIYFLYLDYFFHRIDYSIQGCFYGRYPMHPIPKLKKRLECTYYNIPCMEVLVYVSTSTFVYYYAKRLFSMLSLPNIQISFYFEDIFKSRTSVHLTSNLSPSEADPYLSSSAFYLWGPMCIFSANQNAVPVIFEKGAKKSSHHPQYWWLP